MATEPGARTPPAVDDVDPPCNPSGPDRVSSISVPMAVLSEMPFGLIKHRFVGPACGEAGGAAVTNRQLKMPAASFSIVKSPAEPADEPTISTSPSHCPTAHSAPESNRASPIGAAAGRWAEDCVAHGASVAMPMTTEATNIDEAIRFILKVNSPATRGGLMKVPASHPSSFVSERNKLHHGPAFLSALEYLNPTALHGPRQGF
jgi:hypothetical protein